MPALAAAWGARRLGARGLDVAVVGAIRALLRRPGFHHSDAAASALLHALLSLSVRHAHTAALPPPPPAPPGGGPPAAWHFGRAVLACPCLLAELPDAMLAAAFGALLQPLLTALATDAHAKLLPKVPLAGWDVVLSKDHGACLLEVNLSCNFFRGTFDEVKYVHFMENYYKFCEDQADKIMMNNNGATTKKRD